MVTVTKRVDEGDEAVLDVGCLSVGAIYAWLSGRAFTSKPWLQTPDSANESGSEGNTMKIPYRTVLSPVDDG